MLPTNRQVIFGWKLKQFLRFLLRVFLSFASSVKGYEQVAYSVNFLVLRTTANLVPSLFELVFYFCPLLLRDFRFDERFDALVVHGKEFDFLICIFVSKMVWLGPDQVIATVFQEHEMLNLGYHS